MLPSGSPGDGAGDGVVSDVEETTSENIDDVPGQDSVVSNVEVITARVLLSHLKIFSAAW